MSVHGWKKMIFEEMKPSDWLQSRGMFLFLCDTACVITTLSIQTKAM